MNFKKSEKKFSGDKWGATFKHVMVLDDTHPKNRRTEMTGYSKDMNIPEPLDQNYVLLKQIRVCMEWLQDGRALCATFYKRPDKRYWWTHAHEVLTLFRPTKNASMKDYKILSFEDVPGEVEKQIIDLYQLISEGKSISEAPAISSKHQRKSFEVTLERHLAYGTFKSMEGLREYCNNKRLEGQNYQLLKNFLSEYAGVWFQKQA